jgi:NTE family protein
MAADGGDKKADLVLEGGGVKGIALAGAFSVLEEAGYRFPRVAGTSAGAIVGSLVAAGVPSAKLRTIMQETDFNQFKDPSLLQRCTGPIGAGFDLLVKQGLFKGDYFLKFLTDQLQEVGVSTFDDVKVAADEGASLPVEAQHRLVVMASDLRREELVRLPWDLERLYGVKPSDLTVAAAVRASMAIPFFFRPYYLQRGGAKGRGNRHTMVDGGMLSNFPIWVFDRKDGGTPRWPTFGLKLSAKVEDKTPPGSEDIKGPINQLKAMVGTMTGFYDSLHVGTPQVIDRTIFIDNLGVKSVQFDLDRATQDRLFESGRAAATKFLASWDFDAYVEKYRSP